jgi:hypothetical protein
MKGTKLFIYSAGGILLAAVLERFFVAAGHAQFLSLPEPVLGIPLRYAALLVGGFELVVAMICLFGRRSGLQLGWLAWLATNCVVYRIGLLTMHCSPQATCIGSLTDPLHFSHGITGIIISLLPVYLLLGSFAGILWLWFGERILGRCRKEKQESIKMSCPACGVHIRFACHSLGRNISCPQCQKNITLRKPDFLKMACFFCQEHIQFPTHAIGEKIPCPHCKMDITLKEPA